MNARQTFTPANTIIAFSKQEQSMIATQQFEELLAKEDLKKREAEIFGPIVSISQMEEQKKALAKRENDLFGPISSISLWEEMEAKLNAEIEEAIHEEMKKAEEAEILSCQAEIEFFHPEFRVQTADMAPARVRNWRKGFVAIKRWRLA